MTKRWGKRIAVLAVLATLGAGAAFAAADPGARRSRWMKHMIDSRVEDALEDLNATPQQRQVIDQAKNDIVAKLETQMKTHAGRHALAQILTADNLDQSALVKLIDERAQAHKALINDLMPDLVRIHDTLTTAQRRKLAELMEQHRWGGPGGGF